MTTHYDAVILGAGAMGAAAAYHLSKAGQHVLLLEQFELNHHKGSSIDHSRIIRYSYDHPAYIKLAKAAYPLWQELEEVSGEALYTRTGGIDFGSPQTSTLAETLSSLQTMNIPHEVLSAKDAQQRFPQFRFRDDWQVIYQPDSGFLSAERCVLTHIRMAQQNGAEVRANSPVTSVEVRQESVTIKTEYDRIEAGRLIITAGSWAKSILEPLGLSLPLTPLRCQIAYFAPEEKASFEPDQFPVFIAHLKGEYPWMPYGIPSHLESGVKIGLHGGQAVKHPSEVNYVPDDEPVEQIRVFARNHIPQADAPLKLTRICLYTMTPDEHFIIDKHPAYPHVIFAAGFSGHGFKFSAVVGSIVRDLALTGHTSHDIDLFKASRFTE